MTHTATSPAANNERARSWRPDIQGLRAIAVLSVVVFHARLPLPGGFVGVDVFFVISGFVITGMLHREWLSEQRIRFGRFYYRRFKRLTPALALLVVVVTIASFLLLSPYGPQQTAAKTAIGAMMIVANFVIAFTTGGYFDAPAETNPLLNTWSLSVEEQFYLVFPALLFVGWYLAKRTRVLRFAPFFLVFLVAAGSFLIAIAGSQGWAFPGVAMLSGFYSPLTRAWEFAVGALLALALARWSPRSKLAMALSGVTGLALIAIAFWMVNGTTVFPGPWTLVPVAGTLLLILAGSVPGNPVSQFLAVKPMVKIGDWSYSIYLWHWPFIVFAMYLFPQSQQAAIIAAACSLIPALLSYYFIEQPIRAAQPKNRVRAGILVIAVVLPPVLLAAVAGRAAIEYWQPRYESGDLRAYEGDIGHDTFHSYVQSHFFPCTPEEIRAHALYWGDFLRCQQSHANGSVQVALVGDSHAEHLFLGLAEALPSTNIAYYILNAAPIRSAGPDMERIINFVATDPSIKTVIVTAHWFGRGVPTEEFTNTLQTFVSAGKKVYVTDDTPIFPFDPVQCGVRKAPIIPKGECSVDKNWVMAAYDAYMVELNKVLTAVPEATLIETNKYFCSELTCDMNIGTQLMYRDPNHLNMNGTRYLAQKILEDNPGLLEALSPSG